MKFYRYEARTYASTCSDDEYTSNNIFMLSNTKLELITFDFVSETPKGYWIGFFNYNVSEPYWKKWVSKTSRKRYAYPTKEEALENFIKRTERRINILENQLRTSKFTLGLAKINSQK